MQESVENFCKNFGENPDEFLGNLPARICNGIPGVISGDRKEIGVRTSCNF